MHFNDRLIAFEQIGLGDPHGIALDSGKRGSVKKGAKYRFVTTATGVWMRFGDSSVTCLADGTQGQYLRANQEHYIVVPLDPAGQGQGYTHVAFSRAIVVATDNFVEVK